jgi:hypothetical protein
MKQLPIKKQVCAREYGQKLAELGVNVLSHFCWALYRFEEGLDNEPVIIQRAGGGTFELLAPAYTVAELFAHIPFHVDVCRICDDKYRATVWPDKGDYWVCETGLANTLVEMLIWLIENNHVSVAEINGAEG